MTPEQENMKAWSIMTKSRGGGEDVITVQNATFQGEGADHSKMEVDAEAYMFVACDFIDAKITVTNLGRKAVFLGCSFSGCAFAPTLNDMFVANAMGNCRIAP